MIVKKWVQFEKELEVDISMEDICNAIAEDTDCRRSCLRGINKFYQFMEAISTEVIGSISEFERGVVAKFLREQADRFAPDKKEDVQ